MAAEDSDSRVDWVVMVCPSCQGKCRAPASVAPKGRRCPRCGAALRAAPSSAQPADQEEAEDSAYTARAPASTRAIDLPEPEAVEEVAVRRKRLPAPAVPLWSGVYDFPWHPTSLRAWFLFGIGLSLVALMGGAIHYTLDLYLASDLGRGGIWFRVLILYAKVFILFLLWTGTYAGSFFLATIQETAAGSQKVSWSDHSIWEQFFTFLHLAWIFLCAAVPFGIAVTPLKPYLGFMVFGWSLVPSTILVFPVVLLCALANDSLWMVWNAEVVGNLLRQPLTLLTLYLMSALLLAPCVALGHLTTIEYEQFIFLAPITGFVWSACLLIYGRLLGRVAWVITGGQESAIPRAGRRRKRKRSPTC
jgi:hypothetical protein